MRTFAISDRWTAEQWRQVNESYINQEGEAIIARAAEYIASRHPRAKVRTAMINLYAHQYWSPKFICRTMERALDLLSPFQLGAFTPSDIADLFQSPSAELRLAAMVAMPHARTK